MSLPPSNYHFKHVKTLKKYIEPYNLSNEIIKEKIPIPTNKWYGNLFCSFKSVELDSIYPSPYMFKVIIDSKDNELKNGFIISYQQNYRYEGPKNKNNSIEYYYYPQIKDIIISGIDLNNRNTLFNIISWDQMGITVILLNKNNTNQYLKIYLCMGLAFMTFEFNHLQLSISSIHAFIQLNDHSIKIKDKISIKNNFIKLKCHLNNGQIWLLYIYITDNNINNIVFIEFINNHMLILDKKYSGMIQIAYLSSIHDNHTNNYLNKISNIYDFYIGNYIIGGNISLDDLCFNNNNSFNIDWNIKSIKNETNNNWFLHFSFYHMVPLLPQDNSFFRKIIDINHMKSNTRGFMTAFATKINNSIWKCNILISNKENNYYTSYPYPPGNFPLEKDIKKYKIIEHLHNDIINTNWDECFPMNGSYYFKGKALLKLCTLCLIAHQLNQYDYYIIVINKLKEILYKLSCNTINDFSFYPLVYDEIYGGIITSEIFINNNPHSDFGNAFYNDHHYHYGYYINSAAILGYLESKWLFEDKKGKSIVDFIQILIRDVLNFDTKMDSYFPFFRHFEWFIGHSYSHGITSFADGKDQESSSEEFNLYGGVLLWGKITNDQRLENIGKLLLSYSKYGIINYFLLNSKNSCHPKNFINNKVSGILFDNKVHYTTWFSNKIECIHGIQMLPVSPLLDLIRSKEFINEEWNTILSQMDIIKYSKINKSPWQSLLFSNFARINKEKGLTELQTCPMDDGLMRSWSIYQNCFNL